MFIIVLILYYFDPLKEIFVETNALDYVSSSIFSQKNKHNIFYLIVFISRNITLPNITIRSTIRSYLLSYDILRDSAPNYKTLIT
jgi:hypothetical protein